MNMIRVWGGGFMKWKISMISAMKRIACLADFMFACAIYPGGPEFLASVKAEAEHQVKRLANRACLALWCGTTKSSRFPGDHEDCSAQEGLRGDLLPDPTRGGRPLRRRNILLAQFTA